MLLKETDSSDPEQMDHQVEPVSNEASTMGTVSLRALVGLVRGIPAEERDRLALPDTLDMRIKNFYEVWFDEKRRNPWSSTTFYENRLSQRLNMPLEEVQNQLQMARELSLWFHQQFIGKTIFQRMSQGIKQIIRRKVFY